MLRNEITKLKAAVIYIEEAKTIANASASILSEINVKYDSLNNYQSDFERRLAHIDSLSEKRLVSATATLKREFDEEIKSLTFTSKQSTDMLNSEVKSLKREY